MIVTTLPISYRLGRSFKIFFAHYIAKSIAKLCSADVVFALDLMGLRGIDSNMQNRVVENYLAELDSLGIHCQADSVFSNTSIAFLEYVQAIIADNLSTGKYRLDRKLMSFCTCGQIELPCHVFEILKQQSRVKLAELANGLGFICKSCRSTIYTNDEEVLTYKFPGRGPAYQVFPSARRLLVTNTMQEMVTRSIIVSRFHRNTSDFLTIGQIIIDPDYYWHHYLSFLKKQFGQNQFVLVVGINYIYQACKVIALTQVLDPTIEIDLVVHPIIDFNRMDSQISRKTSVEELVKLCGSKVATQVFLALFVQWNQPDSAINRGDRYLVRISLAEDVLDLSELRREIHPPISLKDALPMFKKDTVLKILKKIRQHITLTEKDRLMLQAIT